MKVTATYSIETPSGLITLTKEQAEALYSQLGSLLNKNTTTPYPINPPASPYVGPYPWTPCVTSYTTTEYTGDDSGYHGVKC